MATQKVLNTEKGLEAWNLALYFKLVALVFPVAVWEVTNTDITSLQARRPGIAVGKQARVQEEISQRIEWGSRKLTTMNAFFVVSFSPRLPWYESPSLRR